MRERAIARQNRVAAGVASLLAFFTRQKAKCQHDMLIYSLGEHSDFLHDYSASVSDAL